MPLRLANDAKAYIVVNTKTKTLQLYKYLPISTRSLGILTSGKIWHSKPAKFNDPFDCGLDLSETMKIEEKIQVLRARMQREGWSNEKITNQLQHSFTPDGELNEIAEGNLQKMAGDIHHNRDNVGILSLSAVCNSVLMWSHYSTEHRGMCIEFNVPVTDSLHEINYSPKMPKYTLYDLLIQPNPDAVLRLFTTKHEDWHYEKEFRIVLDRGDILHDLPGPITAIVFGLRTPPEDETVVRRVAGAGIMFKRCRRATDRFAVEIEDA